MCRETDGGAASEKAGKQQQDLVSLVALKGSWDKQRNVTLSSSW